MRIVFIGCVLSSKQFLATLLSNNKNVVGIVTRKSSNYNADFADLSDLSKAYGVPVFYIDHPEGGEQFSFIQSCRPDVIYCLGWSSLLKKEVIELPSKGVIGFHPAALPYNRGRHPLIWALALGLQQTASTFFQIDEGADTGDILSQVPIPIFYEDDAASLYQRVMQAACPQLLKLTEQLETNSVTRIHQSLLQGNSWRKREEADGEIDWRMPSEGIYNLVRALTKPYFGAHTVVQGKKCRIWRVEKEKESYPPNLEPGKVLQVTSCSDFVVKTGDGAIRVLSCDPIDLQEGGYLK